MHKSFYKMFAIIFGENSMRKKNKNASSEMISPHCEGLQLTSAKVSDDLGFQIYLFCSLI